MTWKAVVREPLAEIPEGQYNAMVTGIQTTKTDDGPKVQIDFILQEQGDLDGRTATGTTGKRLSENTKLGRWVSAILGRSLEVGEEVHGTDLIHHDCRVLVRHRAGDEAQVFGNVVEVIPTTASTGPGR